MRVGIVVLGIAAANEAQAGGLACDPTVGLMQHSPNAEPGYLLFGPLQGPRTVLMDREGRLINEWFSSWPVGNTVYLRDNGNLVRTADPGGNTTMVAGGDAGLIEEFDWDGNLVWSYLYSTPQHRAHHDIALLPNGNILILAWEYYSESEAIAAGRDPSLILQGALWPEHIIELEPVGAAQGNIVWEWHLWDHIIQDFDPAQDNFGVVEDHPELVDINFAADGAADWLHANAIDYNEELDQIVISSPFLNEFWIIDHSTTTAEAAGHTGGSYGRGGDLLYRWGNPQSYGAGSAGDQQLFGQHDVQWIREGVPGAGNVLIFNNGNNRPDGFYTSIDELVLPLNPDGTYSKIAQQAYEPTSPVWSYTADTPTDFHSPFLSGAQRLPNGNTMIARGPRGILFEIDATGQTVWHYVSPMIADDTLAICDPIPGFPGPFQSNALFRAPHYPLDHPAFDGRDLTPIGPIEATATAACGDGVLSSGEQCDDGNTVTGDGCTATCAFESNCPPNPCVDTDVNNIRDEKCIFGQCINDICTVLPKVSPSDLGGSFGACPRDGFVNLHDRTLTLTCFAGTTDCAAINIDAGGSHGNCTLDGFCNIHDAVHVLTTFGGTNTCGCGPAPEHGDGIADYIADMRIETEIVSGALGPRIKAHVYLGGVIDVRGYQIDMEVFGGRRGELELADITIEEHRGPIHADAGSASAFDMEGSRMLALLDEGAVRAHKAGTYLATFVYQASADAAGQFTIDLKVDQVLDSETTIVAVDGRVEIGSVRPAVVDMEAHRSMRHLRRLGRVTRIK
jgi:cysteine-rich repeat protein